MSRKSKDYQSIKLQIQTGECSWNTTKRKEIIKIVSKSKVYDNGLFQIISKQILPYKDEESISLKKDTKSSVVQKPYPCIKTRAKSATHQLNNCTDPLFNSLVHGTLQLDNIPPFCVRRAPLDNLLINHNPDKSNKIKPKSTFLGI